MIHYNLSIVYDYLGRREDAIRAVSLATSLEPHNTLFVNQLCELNFIAEKFVQTVARYENLMSFTPKEPKVIAKYGISLMFMEDVKKACDELEKGVRDFPQDAVLHNTLGMAYFQRKQYKKAVEEFTRASEMNLCKMRFALISRSQSLKTTIKKLL